jgi:hypothetical protein
MVHYFPFEIKFKKILKGDIEKYSTEEILNFIGKKFKESDAEIVEITDNYVSARNKVFKFYFKRGGNSNRWGGIYWAKYEIIKINNSRKAIYSFDMISFFIVGIIIGIIAGLIEYKMGLKGHKMGLIAFLLFGGLNWVAKLIQHRVIFDRFFKDFISEKRNNR